MPLIKDFGLKQRWIEKGATAIERANEIGYFRRTRDLRYFHFAELLLLIEGIDTTPT